MKIYIAAASTKPDSVRAGGATQALTSFAESVKARSVVLDTFPDVLLDSGAFTAFTLGKPIKLADYCDYVKTIDCTAYFNLDVIGDYDATLKNYKAMRAQDLTPIPVFGYGGDKSELEYYLDSTPYVSLGGLVPYTKQKAKLRIWLDHCFAIILKHRKDGKIPRIHGLGVSSYWALKRYPFYSVDSTTWLAGAKFKELIPEGGKRLVVNRGEINGSSDKEALKAFINLQATGSTDALLEYNVRRTVALEDEMSKLWTSRGVAFIE